MRSALDLLNGNRVSPEPISDHLKYIQNLFPDVAEYRKSATAKFPPRPELFNRHALSSRPGMGYLLGLDLEMIAPRSRTLAEQKEELAAFLRSMLAYAPRTTAYYDKVNIWRKNEVDEPIIAIDTEANGLDRRIMYDVKGELLRPTKFVGLCFSTGPNNGYYLPLRHTETDGVPNWKTEAGLWLLQEVLNKSCTLIQNAQYDLFMAQIHGLEVRPYPHFIDTQIAAFLLDANNKQTGLKDLSAKWLNRPMVKIEELFGETKKDALILFDRICASDAAIYGALDPCNTFALFDFICRSPMNPLMFQHIPTHVDHEMTLGLIDMYKIGAPIDYDFNLNALCDCVYRTHALRRFIWDELGKEFSIESPKQLATIIYDELRIQVPPHWKKGLQGAYSTGEEELELLAERNPHVLALTAIVDYRKISGAAAKVHAKFVNNSWCDYRAPHTRVNVDFNLTNVPTGRLSSGSGKGRSGVFSKFNKKGDMTTQTYFKGDWVWGGNSQGIGNPLTAKYPMKKIKRNPAVEYLLAEPYKPSIITEAAQKIANWD